MSGPPRAKSHFSGSPRIVGDSVPLRSGWAFTAGARQCDCCWMATRRGLARPARLVIVKGRWRHTTKGGVKKTGTEVIPSSSPPDWPVPAWWRCLAPVLGLGGGPRPRWPLTNSVVDEWEAPGRGMGRRCSHGSPAGQLSPGDRPPSTTTGGSRPSSCRRESAWLSPTRLGRADEGRFR